MTLNKIEYLSVSIEYGHSIQFLKLYEDVAGLVEETDEYSKAAGVKSNCSLVGDIGCSEGVIDLNDVDDDVDENHDDRDDNVQGADEDE